jgi:predicted SnoaL-like aldol condensation-catalyzing enzyme
MARSDTAGVSKKDTAISFLQLVIAGRIREAYAAHVRRDMRHHNPSFAGDAESLEKAMQENHVEYPHKTIDIKRVFESGEHVAVHSHVHLGTAETHFAAVHIFRFEGNQIVEMWDIVQPVPESSPNTNGMF